MNLLRTRLAVCALGGALLATPLPATAITITSVVETGLQADTSALLGASFGEDALTFSDRVHQHNGAAFAADTGLLNVTGTNIIPLPSYLTGNPYVRFANDAREQTGYSAVVTVDGPAVFYLLIDNRLNGPGGAAKVNTTDPILGGAGLQWVIDGGWVRMNTGISPNGQGDFTGVDEAGDGTLNQFYSVYRSPAPAAQVTVRNDGIAGQNMISLVAAPAPPATTPITSFASQPPVIPPGASFDLSWIIATDATSAVVTPGNTDILPLTTNGVGTLNKTPLVDTTYTLSVTTPGGSATASTTIAVNALGSFTANATYISPGDPVTLSWRVRTDATVTLVDTGNVNDRTDASGQGSIVVHPSGPTTYTLTSEAGGKFEQATQSIVIKPAGSLFALIDLGATGGRPEPGAAGDSVVGAGPDLTNLTDLSLTSLTATDGTPFTISMDAVDRFGGIPGGLDWRDRGDGPGGTLTRLAEDHVKNNSGSVRVVLGGLPAGAYNIQATTIDVSNAQSERILIFVSDAIGAARDTGIIGNAFFDTPALPGITAKLTTALVDSKSVVIPVQSTGAGDVILFFDGTTAADMEVPLAGLSIYRSGALPGFTITSLTRTIVGDFVDVRLEFPSTAGATYKVEATADLSTWTVLDAAHLDSGLATTVFLEPNVPRTAGRRYYRVTRN